MSLSIGLKDFLDLEYKVPQHEGMDLQRIPQPLLVALALGLGVLLIFFLQKPHSVCDSQYEVFKETQKGSLYPQKVKNSVKQPLYPRLVEACKLGNSPGACFELFRFYRKLTRDLGAAPSECLVEFGEKLEIKKPIVEGIQLMVMLAWGDQTPTPMRKNGWLEASDLATFCSLRANYLKMFGEEAFRNSMRATFNLLPAEAKVFQAGVCVNCDNQKRASEALGFEEAWKLSLYSVKCDQYR
ncbi:MAG: hypothetical protein ACK5RO_07785 [Pseudobdellovibrionaceae bacterium]